MTPSDERTWASLTHIAALATFVVPFGSVIGPLVVWLIKRNESAFVDDHGKRSLNFQITMMIWFLLCIPLAFIIVGIFLAIALFIVNIVYLIINAVRASNGQYASYPLALRFIS